MSFHMNKWSQDGICFLILISSVLLSGCKFKNGDFSNAFKSSKNSAPLDAAEPILTDEKIILGLYQMIRDTNEVFIKNGITWWVEGGALIGAMRHGGLIPWDDDADYCLLPGHEKILFSEQTQRDLDAAGYRLADHQNQTYRIYYKDGPANEPPFIDLFKMTDDGNRYTYSLPVWGKRKGKNMFFYKKEVGKPRRHEFGETFVMLPEQSVDFLNDYFGSDWMDIGYQSHVHRHVPGFKPIKFRLTPELRKPGMPTGPLVDNTSGRI